MKPFLVKPFRLKKLNLSNNIFYAPLAGCSDYPFRQMSAKYHPGLLFCEMVKMDALVRFDPYSLHMMDYNKNMHPIGAQLCGSKPRIAYKAAQIAESLGVDALDLNCGCPVDKVTKDGSGSAMLKTPDLIGEVLAEMISAVKIPVTVKIRAGWDENEINAPLITQIAEKAGASAITIHARTRKQGYSGPANWDYIKACKEVAKEIKVIGNGDVVDGPSALKMFEYTGCDGVLVGRATMGRPWIVEEIIDYLEGRSSNKRNLEECRESLLEHFQHTLDYHHDSRAIIDVRRIGCWYLKKAGGTRNFRGLMSKVGTIEDAFELIKSCPLHPVLDTHLMQEEQNEDLECQV